MVGAVLLIPLPAFHGGNSDVCTIFLFHGSTAPPPVGQGPHIVEVPRSHSDTPHSVGLLWTSDQSDDGAST